MKGILGKKLGMTQVFTETGSLIPVTVVEVSPNVITQIKTDDVDGYNAIQLGYQDKKDKHTNKPEAGHFKKADATLKRFTREFRIDDVSSYALGQEISAKDLFEAGAYVDVTGTSKGKGYQGPIKRHGHSRGPETHGSRHHRRTGSLGAMKPVVFKGMKMAGHMGAERVTVQNLIIVDVNSEDNVLLIKGNVPGPKNSIVEIKNAVKKDDQVEMKLSNWETPKNEEVNQEVNNVETAETASEE